MNKAEAKSFLATVMNAFALAPGERRTKRSCMSKEGYQIPRGSVLKDCKPAQKGYVRGLWCSMHGSFNATVPKHIFEKP